MILSEEITFGAGVLDRRADLRKQAEKQAEMAAANDARTLVLYRGKPLFDTETRRLAKLSLDAEILDDCSADRLFLGLSGCAPLFAHDLSQWEAPAAEQDVPGFFDTHEVRHPSRPVAEACIDLKIIMAEITPAEAEEAATARGLFEYHRRHGYCSNCGAKSVLQDAGWSRNCDACNSTHFPRTDPVVIMLVTHGDDVLLGRSPGWPEGFYSLLAGFVEPGETIEAAVKRETWEEAGITVGDVTYLASQPWAFPASLMMGCKAVATSRDINLDPEEIEDARWVSKDEVLKAFSGTSDWLQPARKGSIAQFLLHNWMADRI